MRKPALRGKLAALLFALAAASSADDRDKKVERLNELSARLNRYATDSVRTAEREFLHERIAELLTRARKTTNEDYVFGRLAAAIDDLLDASEEIEEAYEDKASGDDTQERTARRLEDAYFDLKQGEHFAKQSGDPYASDYVKVSRRLYQMARSDYEKKEYARAYDLAEAASEVVAGLESLAQAAVRIPTPPTL